MARNYPRVKTTSHSYIRDLHVQYRGWGGTGPYVQQPHPYTARTTDTVTYGANYPDWRLRLSAGLSATTTLVGTRYSSKMSELLLDVYGINAAVGYGYHAKGYNQQLIFSPPPLASVDSIAEQQAASRFLGQYLLIKQRWAGGAAIAEFAEAIHFLANPIKSLYSHTMTFVGSVGRLRKVYKRDPVKYGKLLGQTWLTYAFGVSPLLSDVRAANAAVNDLAESLGSVDTHRVIGSGENRTVLTIQPGQIAPFTSYALFEYTKTQINQVRYVGSVRAKPPGIGAIAESFGVGLEDILPSVWEAVPWSWLVDYFVNVNEMLEGIRYLNADFTWVNRTVRNRVVNSCSATTYWDAPANKGYMLGHSQGGQGYTQSAAVARTPTTVPYPSWKFRCPGLPSQFANVAALVLAIKGSKPR